jgi:hypothetical protein
VPGLSAGFLPALCASAFCASGCSACEGDEGRRKRRSQDDAAEVQGAMTLAVVIHPIDRALAAISDAIADLLTSNKPSRFAEIGELARTACKLHRQRHAGSVDEVDDMAEDGDGNYGNFAPPVMMHPRRFNDAVDLNRELVMIAQGFIKNYLEVEQRKMSKIEESRLNIVTELTELTALRVRMLKDDEAIPEEINHRIDYLLQRIGEPFHEPQSDPVVHPESVRGHPTDGAREPDRDRVGEPVAE